MKLTKLKIKKGDKVKIIRGNYRGKDGVVEKVLPKDGKVVIAGVNIVKKHVKPRGQQNPGGIVEIAKPINISNVIVICPKCQSSTRIGYQVNEKEKHRICKKCGGIIK
ncbi:50S ribosomal protein L24 [Patescibacteria group bacterium]|nr:50S ribosomal protein L24 [Patescibacteria group bacterium]MBU1867875.1 50S ribosomal protein L24 [Patescibacteria group bacterium]